MLCLYWNRSTGTVPIHALVFPELQLIVEEILQAL
jgi:hypothetical protein